MKPLTLRGVGPELERVLRGLARKTGRSLNRVAIELLERGAGVSRREPRARHRDLDRFSGAWSAEESDAFDRELREQRRVEREVWK